MSQDFQQNPPVSTPQSQQQTQPSPGTPPPPKSPPPPWVSSPKTGSAPPPETPPEEPKKVKSSIFKKLVPLVGFIVLALVLFLVISKVVLPFVDKIKKEGGLTKGKQVTLTYWGLWEPESVMSSLIAEYQKSHPGVTINYSQQSHKDYRERLQSALARSEGPDIFRFHNTWLPMLKKELAPVPSETSQSLNFGGNYYSVINDDLKVGAQFFGIPLGFDTLALFYNTKIFRSAGKSPPTTWEDLRRIAWDLTVREPTGKIQVAGVALGTTNNVDHFSDILGLMMLQNGADLNQPTGSLAEDALRFYTLFASQDKVWSADLPASTYAFAKEKVAMIFVPSWRTHEILNVNPDLEFKTAPVPQLPETEVAWATYWVEGVSAKSKNTKEAWDFLAYLSSKEALTKFYNNASQVRKFGEPYPRKDLASQLETDPFAGAFVKQGSYAQSWYLCAETHDNGINDRMIKYFEDAVNAVLQGKTVTDALTTANQGVSQVLSQYGIK